MKDNIILIMADQQQAALRKAAGYPLDTMPNLDRLGQEGADFAGAYSPNPICAPARCSLLTGRFASAHRVRTNHNLRDASYTKDLTDVLKEAGYVTALCGKNHTYKNPADTFDFHAESEHLGRENGKDREPDSPIMQEFRKFLSDTDFIDCPNPTPFPVECQLPYRNVSSALRFLDTRPKDKPFFLWLSFAEPHNPYQVPKPYYDLFPPESLPVLASRNMDLSEKGDRFVWLKKVWDRVIGDDPCRIDRMRSNYHGMLRLIDDQVGRLLDGLADRGLDGNTIVIYVSDHGDFAGQYGMMRKGGDLCDALTHIPMIWRVPGLKPRGRVSDGFANLTDIFPTLCDLLDLPIPFGVQGKSLRPLLEGDVSADTAREFETAYSESGYGGLYWTDADGLDPAAEGATDEGYRHFDCLNTWTQCGQVRMIRKGNFRLQLDMMGKGYLYDVTNDPEETVNLWDNPDYSAEKSDLLCRLASAQMQYADPLPPPHHRYRIKRHPKNYQFEEIAVSDPGVEK
ncbi:MAG: sulfatase [Eubacteriales bacterium]